MPADKDQQRSSPDSVLRPAGRLVADVPMHSGDHDAIRAHVEKHLGPVANVLQEVVGDTIRIDILHVPPTDVRPVHTLVTCGMSDRPMSVPSGTNSPRYLELMMTLPRTWRLTTAAKDDPRWTWPIRQLKYLARMPHVQQSWLGWGHTVPNGEPPEPLAPNTKLAGAIIVPSLLVPEDFFELKIAAHTIAFFGVVPLYKEELQLKIEKGPNALFEKLIDAGIKDFIDPKRRNVARKRFLFF